MAPSSRRHLSRNGYSPPRQEVEMLIDRASKHALGTEFLREGAIDAVAAIFQVHAFTVERARRHLSDPRDDSNDR